MLSKKISTKHMILCGLFSALIVVGAYTKIPLPLIPFTLQFLFTNLAGLILGKFYGTLSVFIYILMGLMGLPVFTSGGGIGYIFSPTFGFIVAFMIGAFVAGYILHKTRKITFKTYLFAGFSNLIIVYVVGMVYFYFISNYYLENAAVSVTSLLGIFLLTIPGDIVSCFISAIIAKRIVPLIKK